MAGGKPGNKNGLKIKDQDLRQKAYKQYCEWLSQGKSGRSFTFVEGDLMCTGQTIQHYMASNPIEFPPIYKEIAESKGMAKWEQVVSDSAEGKNKDANTASLQMLMRNKYGWDKPQADPETHKGHVVELAKDLRSATVTKTENCDNDGD